MFIFPYFTQKKSREESEGEGSGVEIMINEPYEEGPGGKGQYTRKIYHVGRHLAGIYHQILVDWSNLTCTLCFMYSLA